MTWVLIIILNNPWGVAAHSVQFETKELCEQAKKVVSGDCVQVKK